MQTTYIPEAIGRIGLMIFIVGAIRLTHPIPEANEAVVSTLTVIAMMIYYISGCTKDSED